MSLHKLDKGTSVIDGVALKERIKDEDVFGLLEGILIEMKKMNFQLAIMTDTYIENGDLSDG